MTKIPCTNTIGDISSSEVGDSIKYSCRIDVSYLTWKNRSMTNSELKNVSQRLNKPKNWWIPRSTEELVLKTWWQECCFSPTGLVWWPTRGIHGSWKLWKNKNEKEIINEITKVKKWGSDSSWLYPNGSGHQSELLSKTPAWSTYLRLDGEP